MKLVYIAGKFRAPTNWGVVENVRRAEAVALEVWRLGASALCPHLNTANFDGALPDHVWLAGTLAMLERCDAVVLVPGWEASQGTAAEIKRARDLGLPVFVDLRDFEVWLASAGIGSGGAVEISKDSGPVAALAPAPLGIHRVADAVEETGGDEGTGVKEAMRPGVAPAPNAPRGML